ncbi:MAG TPA: hypothetical protein VNA22_01740 [Pyrinomonadaceae bacterium]|nr:hypothetical protein [Pyrinomonadaceae bacterium]
MSKRSYAEINLHMTWHTKDSFPFITQKLQPELYGFIKNRIVLDKQAYFHAIGGLRITFTWVRRSFRPSKSTLGLER